LRYAADVLLPFALLACDHAPPVDLAAGATSRGPAIAAELADGGRLGDRLPAADDANLVLLYGGEQDGILDTCGCVKRPRGGLARVAGYRRALERRSPEVPTLLVNAGEWLDTGVGDDNRLREDVLARDRWMIDGLQAGGWAALNVSSRELPGLVALGAFPTGAVSANVQPGPPTYVVLPAGDLKVAVTGIAPIGTAWLQPEGYAFGDPLAALQDVVPKMAADADLVVVLVDGIPDVEKLIHRVPGIDVLIEAGDFHERYDPFDVDGTVWVRTHAQTMRLGELRLVVRDGRVVGALDRKIELDDAVPEDPALVRLTRDAADDVAAVQQRVFGP
jgi:2',3'-cyclic-nucleotide 2'-phosphodiesterase (5'-nucleotidase family)